MKKTNLKNKQRKTLAHLARGMRSVVELYRTTEDPEVLQLAVALLQLDLSFSGYYMDKSMIQKIRLFIHDFLSKLGDLKLFAQFSSEAIMLYPEGPRVCDINEAEAFANSFYEPDSSEDHEVEIVCHFERQKYSDTFKQAAKDYYICFMGNQPDYSNTITDRKAYEIIASRAYELIDEIFEDQLRNSDA